MENFIFYAVAPSVSGFQMCMVSESMYVCTVW